MESKIASALGLEHQPVAILLTDTAPVDALRFKPGKWGCVMFLFANAARGRTAAADATTYGCWGGGVGLGFGNAYSRFPGGEDCFARFLSSGNSRSAEGRQVAEAMAGRAGREFVDNFLAGERYQQSPELVAEWLGELPLMDHGAQVVFTPLAGVDPEVETPTTVVLVVDADQLSALVILANYSRPGRDNVTIPWAAGCQTIGILPWAEARAPAPRAVVGLTDLSARKYVRGQLGAHCLTFAMPWTLFLEMEAAVEGSFLERPTWRSLRGTGAERT